MDFKSFDLCDIPDIGNINVIERYRCWVCLLQFNLRQKYDGICVEGSGLTPKSFDDSKYADFIYPKNFVFFFNNLCIGNGSRATCEQFMARSKYSKYVMQYKNCWNQSFTITRKFLMEMIPAQITFICNVIDLKEIKHIYYALVDQERYSFIDVQILFAKYDTVVIMDDGELRYHVLDCPYFHIKKYCENIYNFRNLIELRQKIVLGKIQYHSSGSVLHSNIINRIRTLKTYQKKFQLLRKKGIYGDIANIILRLFLCLSDKNICADAIFYDSLKTYTADHGNFWMQYYNG